MIKKDLIEVGATYIGVGDNVRRVIGMGAEFAPAGSIWADEWMAYELLSREHRKQAMYRKGFSASGLPVYYCSITEFRLWANEIVVQAKAA